MIVFLLITLILTFLYFYIVKKYEYWSERGVKTNKPVFFLGDSAKNIFHQESVFTTLNRLYESFPDERYMGMYQLTLPILVIRDPEFIKLVHVKDFDHFVDHQNVLPDGVDPLWSNNLFALKGDKWRHMRAKLSPTFTSSKMKQMFTLIAECNNVYLDHFLKKEAPVDIELKDTFSRYTNDVIASVAFGLKCDSINERDNEFYVMGKRVTNFTFCQTIKATGYLVAPKLCKMLGLQIFDKQANNLLRDIIYETIKIREEKGIHRPDMISLLLDERKQKANATRPGTEEKPDITDLDIAAQAFIFFFAGFDTVSLALVYLTYELTINPDVQRKLQEEIDETWEECKGKLTYDVLMKMKYMEMVVAETFRLRPPALAGDRLCVKPYVIEPTKPSEKRIVLKPGDNIWVAMNSLQLDPKYFPEPLKFDPERFSDENKPNIQPYTYMPFGNGPRNCIGSRLALMEVKALIFHLLSKFDFVATEKTEIPFKISKTSFDLRPENDLWIQLKPRIK